MILKIIGCILILISSTIIGYSLAEKYVKRPEELRVLQRALQMLEAEISFSLNPLPDAFGRISDQTPSSVKDIFSYSSNLLKQKTGITAQEAWEKAVKKNQTYMHLDGEDLKILLAFGGSLGCSDKENQIKNLRLTCAQLAAQERKAEIQKEKNEKLYKNMGILLGILIVLLFI